MFLLPFGQKRGYYVFKAAVIINNFTCKSWTNCQRFFHVLYFQVVKGSRVITVISKFTTDAVKLPNGPAVTQVKICVVSLHEFYAAEYKKLKFNNNNHESYY